MEKINKRKSEPQIGTHVTKKNAERILEATFSGLHQRM